MTKGKKSVKRNVEMTNANGLERNTIGEDGEERQRAEVSLHEAEEAAKWHGTHHARENRRKQRLQTYLSFLLTVVLTHSSTVPHPLSYVRPHVTHFYFTAGPGCYGIPHIFRTD